MAEVLIIGGGGTRSRALAECLEARRHRARSACSVASGIADANRHPPQLVLLGLELPDGSGLDALDALRGKGLPVVVLLGEPSTEAVVAAIRRGATDCLDWSPEPAALAERIDRVLDSVLPATAARTARKQDAAESLVGEAPALVAILRQIGQLRDAGLAPGERPPILLLGETGTGKGHLASAIHEILGGGPFIEIDCASAPADPAVRAGLFEAARGGTLLLDEVSGLEAALQTKLSSMIEERARALGVQIVASTHCDLDGAVGRGELRADLLHRLRGLSFELPPLRERGDDVLRIAHHLCAELAERYHRDGLRIGEEAEPVLRGHGWPGNVRELRAAVERAILLEESDTLGREVFEGVLRPRADGRAASSSDGLPESALDLQAMERELIERALRQSGGNRTRAARLLGLSRYTLRYRLKKWGLD